MTVWRGSRGVFIALCAVGAVAGCGLHLGTDRAGVRDRAVDEARTTVGYLEERLEAIASADDGPTGRRLLASVQEVMPDDPGEVRVYQLDQPDERTVRLDVAVDGQDESGGGGSYYSFRARVCVRFVVVAGDDPEVGAEDIECRQEDLERALGKVPAPNEVVPYD